MLEASLLRLLGAVSTWDQLDFGHRFWKKAQHVQIQNVSNTTLASLKPIIACKDSKHLHARLHLIKPDRRGRSSTLHFLSPTCQTVRNEGAAQVKVHSRRRLVTGVCFHTVSVIPSACACSCCCERSDASPLYPSSVRSP